MRTAPTIILFVIACLLCMLSRVPAEAEITYAVETPIDAIGYVSADQLTWVKATGAAEIHVWVGETIYFKIASDTSPSECVSDIDSSNDPYYLGDTLHCEWDFGDQTGWQVDVAPLEFPWGRFRLQPPTPDMYEWGSVFVLDGHTYSAAGTYTAVWSVSDRAVYRGAYHADADDEEDPSDSITIYVHDISRPLPAENLNNAAGANRCNIRWANSDYGNDFTIGYGDDFTMPSGTNWRIEKIRVWIVPSVPVWPEYFLGDLYQSIALYTGTPGGALTEACSGMFTEGTNHTDNGNIIVTPVTYPGGVHYQAADGRFNRIWQIDFANLPLEVNGGMTYVFGVHAVPRVDRLCFMHATHGVQGGDGKIRRFDINNLSNGTTLVEDIDNWFGGKGSDINVQVFARSVR